MFRTIKRAQSRSYFQERGGGKALKTRGKACCSQQQAPQHWGPNYLQEPTRRQSRENKSQAEAWGGAPLLPVVGRQLQREKRERGKEAVRRSKRHER